LTKICYNLLFRAQHGVSFELPGGNGRDSGIAGWENMGMGFKFGMGMKMKSLNGRELVRKISSHTPLVQGPRTF